ncbi:MAG: glycosyltransferase [Acidobacteria bacterium]|nr:glycosyltransferase [Acidobacteriota bacterium]
MRDVLYLFPQLSLSPGGIQTVNEDTLQVIARAWPAARHRVLLYINRTVPRPPAATGLPPVRLTACGMRSRRLARLRFALAFAMALFPRRPDLVVVGHVDLAPLAWMAKMVFGTPYVVWAHGTDVWGLRQPLRLASLAAADRVAAVSRYTAESLHGIAPGLPERITIIPNAVRDRFRPGNGGAVRRRLGLDDGARVLLTVARLRDTERYKGCDTVIRALPRVLRRAPDTRYVIVGEGDGLPRLRALAERLGVRDAVVFAGAAPDAELPAYYNACDLFVMPSAGEGFGIVFIEALACGKPVIAGDAGGSRDAVLDGGLGRLAEPGDPGRQARVVVDWLEGRWPPDLTDPARLRRVCVEHFGSAAFDRRVRELVRGVTAAEPRIVARPAG